MVRNFVSSFFTSSWIVSVVIMIISYRPEYIKTGNYYLICISFIHTHTYMRAKEVAVTVSNRINTDTHGNGASGENRIQWEKNQIS